MINYIYVASSWRNESQQSVINELRKLGYDVYDFKNPKEGDSGFHWSEIDPNWKNWNPTAYRNNLNHPIAIKGYMQDYRAMQKADIFIGVQPFGRSASFEMGWAAGQGKHTILLLSSGEPELMVNMFDYICCSMQEVINALNNLNR